MDDSGDDWDVFKILIGKVKCGAPSPSTVDPDGGYRAGGIDNLNVRPNNGGADDPNGDDDSNVHTNTDGNRRRKRYEDDSDEEFWPVNPRNIIITTFTGNNLVTNPYIQLNNQIRKFIITMGEDGEELLRILDVVERFGKKTFTTVHLSRIKTRYPKASQYDRAVNVALLNWTGGIAQGLVRFGTQGGFDAWRKLYNKYIPLADDMQGILIRQLMSIKPVTEGEVDGFFDEVERIRELYIKSCSAEEPMCERWVKGAIMQNLLESITKNNATALKEADIREEVQQIVNTYMCDYRTGLPRGQTSATLYLAEIGEEERTNGEEIIKQESTHTESGKITKAEERPEDGKDVCAATKGKGKGKGIGKSGYGQCWHCGKHGHPRRECPDLEAATPT